MSRSKANEYECELIRSGVTYYVTCEFELLNPNTNEHNIDIIEVVDEIENDVDVDTFKDKLTDQEWDRLYVQCREQSR